MAFYDLRAARAMTSQGLTVDALRATIDRLPPDAVIMMLGDGALVAAQTGEEGRVDDAARARAPSVWLLASSGREWAPD